MIRTLRLAGIAIGSFVIAWLAMSLVGWFLPQIAGTWTIPIATLVLGGLVFRDIVRRDSARPAPDR